MSRTRSTHVKNCIYSDRNKAEIILTFSAGFRDYKYIIITRVETLLEQ
jgi:hypothetical protein